MKAYLARRPAAASLGELRAEVDAFVAYYNEVRPHQAIGRRAPSEAFDARDKARPTGPKTRVGADVWVRRDRIDKGGKVTLRHGTRLHHIGVGHAHKGKRVVLLVAGLDVRSWRWTASCSGTSRWIRAGTTSPREREEWLRCSGTSHGGR
jgi:hypothetical protein